MAKGLWGEGRHRATLHCPCLCKTFASAAPRAGRYPPYDQQRFPHDLGFCQRGSRLSLAPGDLQWRNMLWAGGGRSNLAALRVGAGSPLCELLVMPGLREVSTVCEADFGDPLADVFYFAGPARSPAQRVWVCEL